MRPQLPFTVHLCLLVAIGCTACTPSQVIERRRGDVLVSGRPISATAFAWYNRGLYLERNGFEVQAAVAFEATTHEDPQGARAWAAWGRVLCRTSPRLAKKVWNEGLQRAHNPSSIYRARAECLILSTTNPDAPQRALEDAFKALALEPKEKNLNQFIFGIYEALGQTDKAQEFAHAYQLYAGVALFETRPSPLKQIDRALGQEDLAKARNLAVGELTPGHLASRALAWGKKGIAREQALFVLAAEPDQADATIVQIILGDLVAPYPLITGELSPIAQLLFSRHLAQIQDPGAQDTFLRKYNSRSSKSADPLLKLLRLRFQR